MELLEEPAVLWVIVSMVLVVIGIVLLRVGQGERLAEEVDFYNAVLEAKHAGKLPEMLEKSKEALSKAERCLAKQRYIRQALEAVIANAEDILRDTKSPNCLRVLAVQAVQTRLDNIDFVFTPTNRERMITLGALLVILGGAGIILLILTMLMRFVAEFMVLY